MRPAVVWWPRGVQVLLPGAGLHSSPGNIGQLSPATSSSRAAPGPGCAPHWHMLVVVVWWWAGHLPGWR